MYMPGTSETRSRNSNSKSLLLFHLKTHK